PSCRRYGRRDDTHRGRHRNSSCQAGLGAVRFSRRTQSGAMKKRIVTSVRHDDGQHRCPWPGHDPIYVAYHDEEWGVPVFDDRALYEKLMLDGFKGGLSWITILR